MSDINSLDIYWANLCILNRIEGEKMTAFGELWAEGSGHQQPNLELLGDTAEVDIYERLENDIKAGSPGFDIIVSTRLDIFYSQKYLRPFGQDFVPLKSEFGLRPEIERLGVCDPNGLFLPVVVLPHFIVVNTKLLEEVFAPQSLEELLQPKWEGRVFIGPPNLPSAKSVLLSLWYLFGNTGLETAVQNWRIKSAPSAARHSLVKDEAAVALLPGIFAGPGPDDKIEKIVPAEGCPVLPSFAAVRRSGKEDEALEFLRGSALSDSFIDFYRQQAFAYPAFPEVAIPENIEEGLKMIFPPWEWILNQDIDYFDDLTSRLKQG